MKRFFYIRTNSPQNQTPSERIKKGSGFMPLLLTALLSVSLLLTFTGCSNETPSDDSGSGSSGNATIANPIVVVDDVAAINSELGINLVLPEGSVVEQCSIIDHTLGEVSFLLEGVLFNYRGTITGEDEDISGLYYDFTSRVDGTTEGQSFVMEFNDGGPGYAHWFIESTGTVYSVSVTTGATESMLYDIATALISAQMNQ